MSRALFAPSLRAARVSLNFAIAASICACGAATPTPISAPDTAADPLPYTPPPTMEASTGEVVGLVAVDNGNIAIDVVRGFFEAAATGTNAEIEAFLEETLVIRQRRRRRPSMSRRQLSQQFVSIRRVRGSLAVDSLVDVNALEFTSMDPQLNLDADDRAVLVPIASQGRDILSSLLGWSGASGVVYVRPRTRRIVAF